MQKGKTEGGSMSFRFQSFLLSANTFNAYCCTVKLNGTVTIDS